PRDLPGAHRSDDGGDEWRGTGCAGARGAEPAAGAPDVGLFPGRARRAGSPPRRASIPAETLRAGATRLAGSGTAGPGIRRRVGSPLDPKSTRLAFAYP